MSTHLPTPLLYMQQPEEPPRFVECHGCKRTVDRDECVLVNDEYYCDSCATCGCGQPASSRCPSCDAFTCVACFLGGICTPCSEQEQEIDAYREETDSDFAQFGGRGCEPR